MASPNSPKSSAQLIREHSAARYLKVNALDYRWRPAGTRAVAGDRHLAALAREAMARKYG